MSLDGQMEWDSLDYFPSSLRKTNRLPASRAHRDRLMELLETKYRRIEDTESCMRKFVLLRNCLRRLKREARDEQSNSVHDFQYSDVSPADVSPSCLAPSRYPVQRAAVELESPLSCSPTKRCRLDYDNKENSIMDIDCPSNISRSVDPQDIMRDLVEQCSNSVSNRQFLSPLCPSLPDADSDGNSCASESGEQSSDYSVSCSVSKFKSFDSMLSSSCGISSLMGGDLRSVVYYSLVTSLES